MEMINSWNYYSGTGECSPVVRTDASQASDSGSNPGIRTFNSNPITALSINRHFSINILYHSIFEINHELFGYDPDTD